MTTTLRELIGCGAELILPPDQPTCGTGSRLCDHCQSLSELADLYEPAEVGQDWVERHGADWLEGLAAVTADGAKLEAIASHVRGSLETVRARLCEIGFTGDTAAGLTAACEELKDRRDLEQARVADHEKLEASVKTAKLAFASLGLVNPNDPLTDITEQLCKYIRDQWSRAQELQRAVASRIHVVMSETVSPSSDIMPAVGAVCDEYDRLAGSPDLIRRMEQRGLSTVGAMLDEIDKLRDEVRNAVTRIEAAGPYAFGSTGTLQHAIDALLRDFAKLKTVARQTREALGHDPSLG